LSVVRTISLPALRRLVVGAQGYAGRSRRGSERDVEAAVRRLSCVQLDSISAVERSHRIALASRTGAYPRGTVDRLLAGGKLFEYWAHEACLLPVEDWPLFVGAMQNGGGRHWYGEVERTHPHLAGEILVAIRERGPLGSRHFEGSTDGGMWNWKPAKAMLERLWNRGELVIAGRRGFQRLYDLPERVLPREVLEAPVPGAEARLQALALRAVRARGALTESGIVEHWRLRGGVGRIRPHVDALVAHGRLERVRVADGGAPVVVTARANLDPPRPTGSVLLSPFDNLLWDRAFASRVLGFDHLIEVYKPPPQRRYGYYVLPLLWRDRIVGRADLRSDRKRGVLVVQAFHREDSVRRSAALDTAFERALERLRTTVGLETIER
jgi:uncharacterized protein YcaQ